MKKTIALAIILAMFLCLFLFANAAGKDKDRYSLLINKYNKPYDLYLASVNAYNKNDYKKAEKLTLQSMAAGNDRPFVYSQLGSIYRATEQYEKAIKNYEKFLLLSSDERRKTMAKINLAYSYCEKKNAKQEDFIKATSMLNGEIIIKKQNPELIENELLSHAHTRIYSYYATFLDNTAKTEESYLAVAKMYLTGLNARTELGKTIKKSEELYPNLSNYANNTAVAYVNAYRAAKNPKIEYLEKAKDILTKPLFRKNKDKTFKNTLEVVNSSIKRAKEKQKSQQKSQQKQKSKQI